MKELLFSSPYRGFPSGTTDKEPSCQCKRRKRHGFDPGVRKVHWVSAWTPTPVFSLEDPGEQRSLAGHRPWGHKESDTLTQVSTHTHRGEGKELAQYHTAREQSGQGLRQATWLLGPR